MDFKGVVSRGSMVSATLSAKPNNGTLSIGQGSDPDGAQSKPVPPGTSLTLTLVCGQDGEVEIRWTFASENEGGHLEVREDGVLRDEGDVSGSDGWEYSIE